MFPLWLAQFFKWFNFVERRRLQIDADKEERALERKHQLLLFEGVLNKAIELAKVNNEAVEKLAAAQTATANAFATWLKSFQMPTDVAAQTLRNAVASEEDQWQLPDGTVVGNFDNDLPIEYQLMERLSKMNEQALGDFDREGSDF